MVAGCSARAARSKYDLTGSKLRFHFKHLRISFLSFSNYECVSLCVLQHFQSLHHLMHSCRLKRRKQLFVLKGSHPSMMGFFCRFFFRSAVLSKSVQNPGLLTHFLMKLWRWCVQSCVLDFQHKKCQLCSHLTRVTPSNKFSYHNYADGT